VGVFRKVTGTLRSKANRVLDHFEEPAETYEYARKRQQEMLGEVRARLAEDADERRQVEAKLAVGGAGASSGAARQALSERHTELVDEERRLGELETHLLGRITEFGSLIESVKASKAAASAGGLREDIDAHLMAEDVEAELRRLDAEIRRRR
jgi:phage shock protein A